MSSSLRSKCLSISVKEFQLLNSAAIADACCLGIDIPGKILGTDDISHAGSYAASFGLLHSIEVSSCSQKDAGIIEQEQSIAVAWKWVPKVNGGSQEYSYLDCLWKIKN